jgi:hypothetical protein
VLDVLGATERDVVRVDAVEYHVVGYGSLQAGEARDLPGAGAGRLQAALMITVSMKGDLR